MALVRQPDSPGLWVNPDWVAGTPGTFAVVVGVSSYPHLVGGAGPAADDAYDLPQLYVSALTAYRFFSWLRDRYADGGSPLAQVWLLLAPTANELAAEPALREHALLPTFGNGEEAIAGWFGTMKRLPKASAQGSRAFFFFSGHGLGLYRDKRLLLPADYLRPPACNVNRALSTYNLYAGLAALEVPHQLFFADACRNDHQRLLGSDLEGTDVLNVWANYRSNRNVIAPVLYASASGSQAWQPRTSAEGPSLFRRALLEGLQAQAGFAPDCSSEPCTVRLYSPQTFIERRLTQLLQVFGASGIQQPVRLNGGSDLTVTCVEKATAVTAAAPPPPSRPEAQDIVFVNKPPPVAWHPLAMLRRPDRPGATLSAHEVFGSERLTAAWEQARLFNLASRTWQPATAYTIHSVERDVSARAQRIVLSLPQANEASHWLQLDFGATSFACLLPGDLYGATRST